MNYNHSTQSLLGICIFIFGLLPTANFAQTYNNSKQAASAIAMRLKVSGGQSLPKNSKVAIMPYVHEDGRTSEFSRQFATDMSHAMDRTGTYQMVERARLEAIFEAIILSAAGITDTGLAAQMGKLQGADALVLGEIFEEENSMLSVLTRFVSVETGEVVASATTRIRANAAIKKQMAERDPLPNETTQNSSSPQQTSTAPPTTPSHPGAQTYCAMSRKNDPQYYEVQFFPVPSPAACKKPNNAKEAQDFLAFWASETVAEGRKIGSHCSSSVQSIQNKYLTAQGSVVQQLLGSDTRLFPVTDLYWEVKSLLKTGSDPSNVRPATRREFSIGTLYQDSDPTCQIYILNAHKEIMTDVWNGKILFNEKCSYGSQSKPEWQCGSLKEEF